MLWYKSWLETRARFLTSLVTLTLFCALFVNHAQKFLHPEWKTDFNRLLFVNQQFLAMMWVLGAVLLGMGGIVREKAIGTSSLTLVLPVSRARVLAVRIGVGLLEVLTLAMVPWAAVALVAANARHPISPAQVASYVLLLAGGGLAYFALAVLVSSVISGEYTAPAFTFGIVLLTTMASDAWFRRLSLWRFVTGDFSIDRNTFLLSGHLPWLGFLVSLSIAALMLAASFIVIQKRDF